MRIVPDFIRSAADNIRDGISRKIEYTAVDGDISYHSNNIRYDTTFQESLDQAHTAKRLRAAMSKNADFIYGLLDVGYDIWRNTQIEQPNCGMLVIAHDKNSAGKIADHLRRRYGLDVVVFTEDDPNPTETLKHFKNGNGDVLVAVCKMTEGANVPRLRVGVYAAKKKAPLFLQQVFHRLSRKENLSQVGSGKWVGPADPDIIDEAKKLAEVNFVTLGNQVTNNANQQPNSSSMQPAGSFVPISAVTTSMEGFCGDLVASQHELKRARDLRIKKPKLYANISDVQLGKIAADLLPSNETSNDRTVETYDQIRLRLGRTASKLANKLAHSRSVEPREIHTEWIANGNARHEAADNEVLQAKVDWLVDEIEREQIGQKSPFDVVQQIPA
jgi:hypothetical protein